MRDERFPRERSVRSAFPLQHQGRWGRGGGTDGGSTGVNFTAGKAKQQ